MPVRHIVGAIACLFIASSPIHAASLDLDRLETDDLRLIYVDPVYGYIKPHVAASFHNSMDFQKEIFEWDPWDITNLLLKDQGDYGNAAARSSPNNAVAIDIAPLSRTYETFTASERVFTLMNHELVHVATMDVWNKRDARWRKFFHGKPMPLKEHPESILYNYLATPRVNVPRWYLEGSAVFMETWMGGRLGRAIGGYDEMVFRSMVRDNAHFYSALGLVSEGTAIDFQVGVNAYLYGTRFISYMALTHSPEQVVEWLKRSEDSKAYYARQFEHVFGLPLTKAWDQWIAWEHEFQTANLASVTQNPVTETTEITPRALGSISRSFINPQTNSLIGAFRYPGVVAHIGDLSLDTGDIRRLADIQGPMLYKVTSLAYDPDTNKLWYTTDNYKHRSLIEVDVSTGRTKPLLKKARIGELVLNPADKSLWGVRHLNGKAALVRMPAPYTSWNLIHTFDYGKILYDLDISPDGGLLSATVGQINGKQKLHIFRIEDLMQSRIEEVAIFDFSKFSKTAPAIPEGFVFSKDGKYLYGSSYLTGISNIYRFEVATGDVQAVSNAVTGFFRPIPQDDGSLIVFEYTGQGFTPKIIDPKPLEDVGAITFLGREIARKHPVVDTWRVGSFRRVDWRALVKEEGKYRPLEQMRLGSAYPVVEGYQGYGAYGWHLNFEDPLQFNKLMITATYTPDEALDSDERFHASIDFKTPQWRLRYWHNDADFYDLFGPKERSRKGDAFIVDHDRKIKGVEVSAQVAYFTGLDTLPANQNVATASDDLFSTGISLHRSKTQKSLGSVDHEKGYQWDLGASFDHANKETFAKLSGGFDIGWSLPLKHSSVWIYSAGGIADGSDPNPLSNFYFGGFGNNYVDDREVKRYRQAESFPGFEFDEISSGNFVKAVAEWNLPPLRFREFGTPSLYLGYLRPAFFAGVLHADPGETFENTYANVGGQLDFHFTLAHRLPMTLSVGYAVGFDDGDKAGEEAMISLKIM